MIFECEAMASRDNNGNLQSCSVFWCDPHVMWENVIDRTGRVMVFLITRVSPPCCHECAITLGFVAIRGGGDGAQQGAVPARAQPR